VLLEDELLIDTARKEKDDKNYNVINYLCLQAWLLRVTVVMQIARSGSARCTRNVPGAEHNTAAAATPRTGSSPRSRRRRAAPARSLHPASAARVPLPSTNTAAASSKGEGTEAELSRKPKSSEISRGRSAPGTTRGAGTAQGERLRQEPRSPRGPSSPPAPTRRWSLRRRRLLRPRSDPRLGPASRATAPASPQQPQIRV